MSPKVTTAHEQGQRDRILDAATRCFAARGFHEATIQDVCDGAGLSKGGLYTYFRSKDEILAALIERSLTEAMTWATKAAGQGGPALQRLDRVAEAMIETVLGDTSKAHTPQLMLEVWAEASKDPYLGDLLARGYEQWRMFIAQLLREGIAGGEIRADLDPNVLAAIFVAIFDGLTLQESITKTKVNWQHAVATLRSAFTEGILAPATSLREG